MGLERWVGNVGTDAPLIKGELVAGDVNPFLKVNFGVYFESGAF